MSQVAKLVEDIGQKMVAVLGRLEQLEKKVDRQCTTTERIETSMELLSHKYDELIATIAEQEKDIAELKTTSVELMRKVAEKDTKILRLKENVESAEQYSRRKNIEIHGVPCKQGEYLYKVLAGLSAKLEIQTVERHSLEAVHRLNEKKNKTPPITVRFKDLADRDLWASNKYALQSDDIYINENLIRAHKSCFGSANRGANSRVINLSGCAMARFLQGGKEVLLSTLQQKMT